MVLDQIIKAKVEEYLRDALPSWKLIDDIDYEDWEIHILYTNGDADYFEIEIPKSKDGIDGKDWKDWKNYILTQEDKEEIAREITVPIVEKIIERTEIIKEQPIITNEIKEVAKYEEWEQIVKKINELELDEDKKIDAKHIKNLPENTTIIRNVASWIGIKEDWVNKTTEVKSINFTGATVTDNNGNVTVDIENPDLSNYYTIPETDALLDEKQPYVLVTSDQSIAVWSVYWAECISDIILTLSDGTSEWQTLTVKKLDDTDYSVYVNTNSLIDWESSIEITMEWESYDFYWTGSTFIIK